MLVFTTQQFRSFWLPIFQSFVINCKELQIAQTVQINHAALSTFWTQFVGKAKFSIG